jgi:putative alpha-1,2-mannosidase
MFHDQIPSPLCHVNPLQGTDTRFELSNGNTYPVVTRPWGMTAWSPQTSMGNWFFEYRSPVFRGIRATHQPSPWLRDYGHFLITPLVGQWCDHPQNVVYPYDIKAQSIHPHGMLINLPSIQTTLKLTPTQRCALMQMTMPTEGKAGLRLFNFPGSTTLTFDAKQNRMICSSTANNGAVPEGYALYFVIESSSKISHVHSMDATGALSDLSDTVTGESLSAIVHFSDSRNARRPARRRGQRRDERMVRAQRVGHFPDVPR